MDESPYLPFYKDVCETDTNCDRSISLIGDLFRELFRLDYARHLADSHFENVSKVGKCKMFDPENTVLSKEYIINSLGTPKIKDVFLSYQEISSNKWGSDFLGWNAADLNKMEEISGRYIENNEPIRQEISAVQLLRRTQALSCAGCHQFANDKPIGEAEDGN